MFHVHAPVIVIPTVEAEQTLRASLRAAGQAAYREIAFAAKGLEIDFLQFSFEGRTLAVCSRVRRSGAVEIEMGLGNAQLPSSTFTREESRRARTALQNRVGGHEAGRRKPRVGRP